MENYLVINGKRVDLTEEQVKQLGLEVKKKNPFDRANIKELYYAISDIGRVERYRDSATNFDNMIYRVANYCTNKELMTARAKEEVLSRLLWRFSMENGGSEIDFAKYDQAKYYIYKNYSYKEECFLINSINTIPSVTGIYFISEEIAQRAIDEIVKPFYAGELEVCKIWEE